MKALFLTRYDRLGASTRYRTLQYLPYLESKGWEVQLRPLFSDRYLKQLYSTGTRSPVEVLKSMSDRCAYLLSFDVRAFDVIYIQYDLFPYVPYFLESLLLGRGARIVLDYDDAMFVSYQTSRLLKNKIGNLMGIASEVIVGNEFLRSYAAKYTQCISVIPTVIDLTTYNEKEDYEIPSPRPIVIGWVGTPVTARYLAFLAPVLQQLARKHSIVLRCVGTSGDFAIPGVAVENLPWDETTEAAIIKGFDIGVMPLVHEPFAMGKCAFKLIQYMGCGVPSVGADLGANAEVIEDGVNGFLAELPEQYLQALEQLIANGPLRERVGRAGRKTVEQRYSLSVTASRFQDVLERVATDGEEAKHGLAFAAGSKGAKDYA